MKKKKSAISFCNNGIEMLRIERSGFYVRGKKTSLKDEDTKVYKAFHQWLTVALKSPPKITYDNPRP